jgi:FimV-like protein
VYHAASSTTASAAPQAAAQVPVAPTPIVSSSSDMSNGAAMINTAGVDTSIESQVSMLSQASIAFEQETDQHIQNLVDSNQAMGAALQTTNQEVVQLQEAVSKLAAGNMITPPAKRSHGFNREELSVFIEFGGAAAFLLLLGVLMGRFMRRRAPVMVMPGSSDDISSEYDFMSTAEAIPAKLDLARSYLMMGDFDQARMILKTVMEKGSNEHQSEAESILNKIKSAAKNE